MAQGPQWCTIESDPGVFTELIAKFGVKNVQVEEIWDLEDTTFNRLGSDIYGLIFLFKWDSSFQTDIAENIIDVVPEGVFFAKQMIHNACATQAILSILLNSEDKLELGEALSTFRSFATNLDPESAGIELQNSDVIRNAHNSFARPEPIQIEIGKDEEGEDAFHFISYVPKNGILYEIDGLQKAPRLIGECEDKSWYESARPVIQQRMEQYGAKELRFTLLALVKNLQQQYETELEQMKDTTDEESTVRKTQLEELIQEEKAKHEKWKRENIRRRHNYFPFVFTLLRVLAENNLLDGMTERAAEKKLKKLEEKEKREAAEKEKAKEKEEASKDSDKDKSDKDKTDADGDVQMSDNN